MTIPAIKEMASEVRRDKFNKVALDKISMIGVKE